MIVGLSLYHVSAKNSYCSIPKTYFIYIREFPLNLNKNCRKFVNYGKFCSKNMQVDPTYVPYLGRLLTDFVYYENTQLSIISPWSKTDIGPICSSLEVSKI